MSIEFHILKEFLTVIESVELRYAIIIGNFLQKDPCCGLKMNTPSFISFLDQFSLFGFICIRIESQKLNEAHHNEWQDI